MGAVQSVDLERGRRPVSSGGQWQSMKEQIGATRVWINGICDGLGQERRAKTFQEGSCRGSFFSVVKSLRDFQILPNGVFDNPRTMVHAFSGMMSGKAGFSAGSIPDKSWLLGGTSSELKLVIKFQKVNIFSSVENIPA